MRKVKRSNSVSLSATMTMVVVSIVVLSVVVALIIFNMLFLESMEKTAVTNTEQSVNQVSVTINNYTHDMVDIINKMYQNTKDDPGTQEELFEELIKIRPDVVMVATYDAHNNNTGIWSNYKVKDLVYRNLSQPSESYGADGNMFISAPHVVSVFENNYPWVVTITKNIGGSYSNAARISLDVSFSGIAGYIDGVGIGQHGYCFIMDSKGNIIYHPQQQLIYAGIKTEKEEIRTLSDGSHINDGVIYTVKTLDNSNWKIIGVTFLDETVNTRVKTMIFVSVIILILAILLSFLSGTLFSYLFTKPVKRLTGAMEKFENDASGFVFEPIESVTEVNELSDSFEHLVVRIQELMEEVKREENTLRKTELKALQAQINPHFLYNTLDAISWMCEEGKNDEAVLMVNALAKLFRISISRGHEFITIDKEMQHAECYLQIQKFRYTNHFDYRFEIDDSVKEYFCNKITLQPIIENALYHGLNMIDEGLIIIRIFEDEGDIVLEVEDNGVGMSADQVEELFKNDATDRIGIGVKNVNDRIKICFGEKYGIKVRSELDEGTCVSIRIPKITEVSKYEK